MSAPFLQPKAFGAIIALADVGCKG